MLGFGSMANLNQPAGGRSDSTLLITHRSDELVMASFGVVCVALWNSKPTRVLFEHQRAALATCVIRYPGRALFLCAVSSKSDPPDQELRDASVKMLLAHERRLAGCACVIEGTGFRAAITRTVLTGMTLLARTQAPIAFFDQIAPACTWLEPRAEQPLRALAEQLVAVRKSAA